MATRLGQQNAWWAALLARMLGIFFRSAEKGAETSILVASSPALAGVSGKYFANSKEAGSSPAAQDMDAARRLWDVSAWMVGVAADAPGG